MAEGKVFDPKKIFLYVNGTRVEGLDSDNPITIERNNPRYSNQSDLYGKMTRYKNVDNSYTVTVVLSQESKGNNTFSNFVQADKVSDAGVFAIAVHDKNGESVFFGREAYVSEEPNLQYGSSYTTREWKILVTDTDASNYVGGIL